MNAFKLHCILCLIVCFSASGWSQKASDTPKPITLNPVASDSLEYSLIITDAGYDTYLVSQPVMDFYSENYYKSWNQQYVIEWNYRAMQRPSMLYENTIDYNSRTEYGIKLEYQLYNYFRFFEQKNKITLVPRGR